MRRLQAQYAAEREAIAQRVRVAKGNLDRAQQDVRAAAAKNRIDQEILKLAVEEMQAWYDEAKRQLPLTAEREGEARAMAVGIAIGTWRGWAAALARTSLVAALAAERERWILWLPVALGCGIAGYFALANEPARWVAPVGIAASTLLALLLRRSQGAVLLAAALGAVFAGAALAQWRTAMVAASVLERRWGPDEVTGRVVAVEIRPEGRRVVLDRVALPGLAPAATPAQVRVRLAEANVALRPGDRIAVRAQLFPPPPPAAPGAYDFQFQAWFLQLGAVGTARGRSGSRSTPCASRPFSACWRRFRGRPARSRPR